MMNRIASPLDQLAPHYTVVVVGSGYGAGVAASRLARTGQSVCVLERGREILPGEYPDDLAGASAQMQVTGARGTLGSGDALFDLRVGPDMLALVGCGLGGTSLINANVTLEMDPRLFSVDPAWPAEFRSDPHILDPYVERARAMLDPSPYPADFPPLAKMQALERSAHVLKQPFRRPPIAVNFIDQVNPFGVAQPRCTLCGDCTSGCNVGAKNTTLMNYLPDAKRHGAHIFTGARVTHVERDGTRWRVHFEGGSVGADVVMLGAGSLGSTEILLRSRQRGLPLSDRIGQRFSGNGDVLALGYDNRWLAGANGSPANINGIGAGTNDVPPDDLPGPCITGVIDMRQTPDVRDGLVIEEGVIPGALASLMPPALFFWQATAGNFFQYGAAQGQARLLDAKRLSDGLQDASTSLASLAYTGPVARMQTYLVMSVDDAGGQLVLENDRVAIRWPGAGTSPVIARDNAWLRAASDAIDGQFVANPLWSEPLGWKLVTVHPVGGCGMGDAAAQGVVDHQGRVFAGTGGTDVHEGLYVCDGAVLPGAVGVNPLLTITALAERTCQRLADARGWRIDLALAARQPLPDGVPAGGATPPPAPAPAPVHPGLLERLADGLADALQRVEAAVAGEAASLLKAVLDALENGAIDLAKAAIGKVIQAYPEALSPRFQFTEAMHGWISLQAVVPRREPDKRMASDYEVAAAWGRARGQAMRLDLTIRTDDLHRLLQDPAHAATITGSVTCPSLSETPMPVTSGTFRLLPVDTRHVETWTMNYEMVLQRGDRPVRFSGHKVLHQRAGSSWWADTTTLFVRVHDGADEHGPLLALGVLTLDLEDLLWQGSTVRVDPPASLLGDLEQHIPAARDAIAKAYLAKFGAFFGTVLLRAYGGLLADLANFPAADTVPPPRPLAAPTPERHDVDLPDGFRIRLTRYRGGDRGPVVLAPGFSVRASSFALDTVDRNLVEVLCAQGYDTWLFDYRASPDSGSPIAPYTIDDIARVDWPFATRHVLQTTGAPDLQAIAHCVGSMSLFMALLEGMTGVRSVISSQLTLHPVTGWLNDLKADLHLVRLLEGMKEFAGGFDLVPHDTDLDHAIDAVAWSVPVPDGESCKNPLCHRVFGLLGPSYAHDRLNHWTHETLARMFGQVSLAPLEQLSRIMRRGQVVDAHGQDTYVAPAKARRLALPITFVAGARNQLFFPDGCARTQAWLAAHNDPALYTRHVFEGYAHMDMFVGRDAARDIFPFLVAQLERFSQPAA